MGRILRYDDNGEITNDVSDKTHYIRSESQNKFLKKREEAQTQFAEFNDDAGKFVWSYPAKIQKLIKSNDFTKSDLTMIFYLSTYVNGTGYLSYNNQLKIDKAGLQKVLGIGRNLFNKFFNKLVNYQIISTSGEWFKWNKNFNFYGSTKGVAKPTELVRSYVYQIRELYEAKDEKGKRKYSAISLYPVFALVPYLHKSTNIVCKNPEVKNIEEINYYSLLEIAELLDLKDSKKMSSALSSIQLAEQSVFRKIEIKNEKYLQMNPRIVFDNLELSHF